MMTTALRWKATLKARALDCTRQIAGYVSLGLDRFFGSRAPGVGILLYHRVAPRQPDVPFPTMNVTPARFRAQITGLLRRGFQFQSLRKVLEAHQQGQPLPPRSAVLTFDDGFESVWTGAWPVLRELQVPATVFVSTAYLNRSEPFPFDPWGMAYHRQVKPESYRPLTMSQCQEMLDSGLVDLGPHTHTHRDFRGQPELFEQDLQLSIVYLESHFGITEQMFAFPFGRRKAGFSGEPLVEAARRAGVVCSLTTEAEPVDLKTDPFHWGRFNVYEWDNGATLAARLRGWYSWAPRLQNYLSSRTEGGSA